jgi:hypothetical protein
MAKKKALLQKRGRGRPSEYTPERVAPILALIAEGNPPYDAVAVADVCAWNTYVAWSERYPDFLTAIKKAEAVARCVARGIVRQGKLGWQGCARWLEAMEPEHWARPQQMQHSGDMTLKVIWENGNGNGGKPHAK